MISRELALKLNPIVSDPRFKEAMEMLSKEKDHELMNMLSSHSADYVMGAKSSYNRMATLNREVQQSLEKTK